MPATGISAVAPMGRSYKVRPNRLARRVTTVHTREAQCSNVTTFPPEVAPMTTLTSRELNQDIGRAKREAAHGPVFITDRGKPSHVLLSIEAYERLTGSHRTLAEALHLPGTADIDVDFHRPRALSGSRIPDFDTD